MEVKRAMPIQPKIQKKLFDTSIDLSQDVQCAKCMSYKHPTRFAHTRSVFFPAHHVNICNDCIEEILRENEYAWDIVDKVCQWADIPFIVREWERIKELNEGNNVWETYAHVFEDECYQGLGWADYNKQYQKLREAGMIEDELPYLDKKKLKALHKKWGANYDEEELAYLEDLEKGLIASQNIAGDLQIDQARKICKLSLEIDSRIRAGDKDVDKFLSSYDKLVKIAEFTPKNTKNANDFDSFAEVCVWLEKRGHQNRFYDNVTRDVIDETLKNIENYNQKLYVSEGGIGEEITERLRALKESNKEEESLFGLQGDYDLDVYDNEGFTFEETEEFDPSEEVAIDE